MTHPIIHLILVVSVLILLPFNCYSSSLIRYRTNLAFYGGYSTDHRSILYTNSDLEDWKNLTQLAEDGGLREKALLCGLGSGAWLAYPGANFQSSNGNNYTTLLIGDACIPADNINSVQAVCPINKNKEELGLITFTEPNFASDVLWLTNETKTASGVKSLICPADLSGEWTVEGDGIKVCVIRPKDLIATGVCIFPDLSTQLNIQSSATVTFGCPDIQGKKLFSRDAETNESEEAATNNEMGGSNVILMQTCFGTYGAYKIVDNYLSLPQLTAICKDNADESHKTGFFKIIDAWKFRMNKDRQEELNPADIDLKRQDKKTPLRMKLLTYFFEIFEAGCPNVPKIYFNLLRFLFMQHLKSVWEEVPTIIQDKNDTTLTWTVAAEYLTECYKIRLIDPVPTIPDELQCIVETGYEGHEEEEDWEESAFDLFLSGDSLDHVIEQVWLILNYVSPYCATVDRFKNNNWAEFTNMFRRNFLLPLLQQWLHPGTWQVYYDYIFSGLSLQKGKRQIISCLQDILLRTPVADPIDRPSASVHEFMNLSKKKTPVELGEVKGQRSDAKSKIKRDVNHEEKIRKKPHSHKLPGIVAKHGRRLKKGRSG